MKSIMTVYGTFVLAIMLAAAVFTGGCGSRTSSGAVANLPPPAGARGTLKLTNVPAKTIITCDGQQAAIATGTITIDVQAGKHVISVSRAGYAVDNAAALQDVPVAVGAVTEKSLSFTRDTPPLPDDWIVTGAGRLQQGPINPAVSSAPLP